jgi:E3 ubiquitin-protein ligase UHRF1
MAGIASHIQACGGRNLKGTKANPKNLRTAPQSSDQTLTGLLKISCDNANPIRVIQGFKGHLKWAPSEKYKYLIPGRSSD